MDANLVRQALPDDRQRLKTIIDLSFPRFFRHFASYSIDSEDGQVLVLETQGTVMGFVKLIKFSIAGDQYGCILWIAVHPMYRRRGIALKLTNAGIQCLEQKGAQAVFASTQRRNTAAKATLGKAGFRQLDFLGMWRAFGWRVLSFYSDIWYAPGEIVYMHDS